jgi:hypothetical protein
VQTLSRMRLGRSDLAVGDVIRLQLDPERGVCRPQAAIPWRVKGMEYGVMVLVPATDNDLKSYTEDCLGLSCMDPKDRPALMVRFNATITVSAATAA